MLKNELEIDNLQEYYWTDSKVVLEYINTDARLFHVFVSNRIQKIKSTTDAQQWYHAQSEDNPADHASRGLSADQLVASNWFTGPDFLWEKELPTSDAKVGEVSDNNPEVRKAQVLNTSAKVNRTLLDRLTKFSDWRRAVKAIACLKCHAKQVKGLNPKLNRSTSVEERQQTELFIIRLVLREVFSSEIKSLQQCMYIKSKDKANKL